MGKREKRKRKGIAKTEKKRSILTPAAAILLALGGAHYALYKPTQKQTPIHHEQTLEEAWQGYINMEGVHATPDFFPQYPFLHQRQKADKAHDSIATAAIIRESDKHYDRFKLNPTPENYTEEVMSVFYVKAGYSWRMLKPTQLRHIFKTLQNPLYQQLKTHSSRDTDRMVERTLSCATLMVQQQLDYVESSEEGVGDYMRNLRNRVGDCVEYSYATASVYYDLCAAMRREGLIDRIRITIGVELDTDFNMGHGWIDYLQNGEWKRCDPHLDKISRNAQLNLTEHGIPYAKKVKGTFVVPLSSTRLERSSDGKLRPEFYLHVLPRRR